MREVGLWAAYQSTTHRQDTLVWRLRRTNVCIAIVVILDSLCLVSPLHFSKGPVFWLDCLVFSFLPKHIWTSLGLESLTFFFIFFLCKRNSSLTSLVKVSVEHLTFVQECLCLLRMNKCCCFWRNLGCHTFEGQTVGMQKRRKKTWLSTIYRDASFSLLFLCAQNVCLRCMCWASICLSR